MLVNITDYITLLSSDGQILRELKMIIKIGSVSIEAIQGDIANQPDMAAIVNAANAELRMGGGVAGAIHRAAGPALEKECRPLAPIKPGEAVITGAHQLPNQYVIHCLGPVYGVDRPEDQLLAKCYYNILKLADDKKIDSIAIPAISTGVFGYPITAATEIALKTIRQLAPKLKYVKHIRLVLFSKADFELYKTKLEN